jgi:Heterokaryon incompatibility protein (HET)
MWIDAICIDQANIMGCNQQVNNMRKIYSRARKVHIWLGLAQDDSHVALNLAQNLYDERFLEVRIARRFDDPDISRQLKALAKLFSRPYWGRIWVFQEATLAKTVVAYGGAASTGGVALSEAQSRFITEKGAQAIRWIVKGLPDDPVSRRALKFLGPLSINKVRDACLSGSLRLFEIVQFHFSKRCSDPKDMIYGRWLGKFHR